MGGVAPAGAAGSDGARQLRPADLLGPTDVRALAASLGIEPSKRLGQNFVVDAGTVMRITAMAGLDRLRRGA